MRWVSRLVTITTIVVVVALAALFIRSRMPETHTGQHFETWALFRDGSRVVVGSPVMIAGVRVGDVTKLTIEGQFARIDMRLIDGLQIPVESFITKRATSVFGDSYLEIIPEGGEGAASVRYLKSGEPITHVIEGSSTDTVLRAIGRAMPKVDNALEVVHNFMTNGRTWVNGPMAEAVTSADRWVANENIEGPLRRADNAMERFEDATTRGARAVADARPEVASKLARFDDGITSARRKMADFKTGLVGALRNTREGLDRVDPTIDQMSEVMTAINEGRGDDWKGTLGRLVNDPELGDTIDDATETLRDATSTFNRFRSWIGARIEANVFARASRVEVYARIETRTDKLFLIGFEKGPLGGLPADSLTEIPGSPAYLRDQDIGNSLRFTAQFGKRFGPLALRAGVKESTVGVGADLLVGRKLELSADVFGAFDRIPRLKLLGALEVFRSLYVVGGVDDALNTPGYLPIVSGNTTVPKALESVRFGRDYFFGAELRFSDADLAALLRVYGALIVSAVAF